MDTFVLDTDTFNNARSYMPLEEKMALAYSIAPKCVLAAIADGGAIKIPNIYIEDNAVKAVYLMQVLVERYIGIPAKSKFTSVDYDYYAGGHILNQIERFKGNSALKDKAFDLLSDFKDFKKLLDCEIINEKTKKNDALMRGTLCIQALVSADNIKALKEELDKQKGLGSDD